MTKEMNTILHRWYIEFSMRATRAVVSFRHRFSRASSIACVGVALLTFACVASTAAHADNMSLIFNNATQYQIDLKLYARDRGNQWPSFGRAYSLAAGSKATKLVIECTAEERICYGAWTPHPRSNTLWGAGKTGLNTCETCCFVCKDGSVLKAVTLRQYIGR